MFNQPTYLEMTTMFETLRVRLKFRELKTHCGDDQALEMALEAFRLEFASALDIARPVPDQMGSKKEPVEA